MSRTGIMSTVSCQQFHKLYVEDLQSSCDSGKCVDTLGIIGTQSQARLCTRHAVKLYFKIFYMILVPLGQGCPTFFLFVRGPQPLLQAGT